MYWKIDDRWFGGVEVRKKDKMDEGWIGEMHEWILWGILQINQNYMDIVRCILENTLVYNIHDKYKKKNIYIWINWIYMIATKIIQIHCHTEMILRLTLSFCL